MEFRFSNLSVFSNKEKVIKDVSGSVKQGEILMVIGHPDSGHSLLLSTFAGRCPLYEGEITADDAPIQYSCLPRKVAYVTQADLFLPTLTVGENLKYAGLLRLTQSMHERDKMKIIHNTELLMGLQDDTLNPTQFANRLIKKCLSIASELFQPAEVLILDEPFTGLNYEESRTLMTTVSSIASKLKKAIIIGTSEPTSYQLSHANELICLSHGQTVYEGVPDALPDFLNQAGFHSSKCQGPLDLLMESILDSTNHNKLVNIAKRHGSEEDDGNLLWYKNGTAGQKNNTTYENGSIRETVIDADIIHATGDDNTNIENHSLIDFIQSEHIQSYGFHTSYCHQLSVLTARNFHNSRRRILSPISLIQNGYILVLCVLVWWRTPRIEETVKDRMGLFFFTTVQWAFFSLLDAILTFPKELKVIQKEKTYKLYKTSAYCIAKTISEFPLAILQPCLYLVVIYWVANLNNVKAFVGSLGVLIADVIAAQSVGLFLGTALNPPWTVTVVPLGLLSMMLWGGAFSTPPKWLQWGKYASFFTYGLQAFISLEFTNADPIKCSAKSMVPMCNMIDPSTNTTITHFPSEAILMAQNITWSAMDNSAVLIGLAVITRVMWYIVLRLKRG